MEKILDVDFRVTLINALKEANISNTEANSIVAKKYKQALKEAVVARLKEITHLIIEDKYDEVSKFIEDSPAGDGYGCDNSYISFADVTQCEDIGEVIYKLNEK